MTAHDFSRRTIMRGALKAGAYSAPLIVSTAFAREVYAVSPAPLSTGSIIFAPSGSGYLGQGNGASPNAPFLFLLSDSSGDVLANKVVETDSAGRFTVTISPSGHSVGNAIALSIINGGNIFVDIADTFIKVPVPTPSPTVTVVPGTRSVPPTLPGPPTAGTAIALTATAEAKGT
jgi:hypothetical protein